MEKAASIMYVLQSNGYFPQIEQEIKDFQEFHKTFQENYITRDFLQTNLQH